MVNVRSPNLTPVALEDCFDTTSLQSVREFSESIQYEIQKQKDAGMSANVMFTILHFYAADLMETIREDAAKRMEKHFKPLNPEDCDRE